MRPLGVFYEATKPRGGPVSPTPTPTPSGPNWSTVLAPIEVDLWATKFYQDRAGTTSLVTATGQDVRCIRHPTTDAIIWQSPLANPGNCWKLTIIGGVPYLQPKNLAGDSILDTVFGSSTAHFQFGLCAKTLSVSGGGDLRVFSPRNVGEAAYLSHKPSSRMEFWNGGGDVMQTAADFGVGTGGVIDGYCTSDGTVDAITPVAYASLRKNTTELGMAGGVGPDATKPGTTMTDGIRLGGVSAGFGGFAPDILIRALYWHQASTRAGLLAAATRAETNTWMQGLTL
jgi:hypothetical protein